MFFLVCLVVLVTVLAVAGAVLVEVGRSVSRGFGRVAGSMADGVGRLVSTVSRGPATPPGALSERELQQLSVTAVHNPRVRRALELRNRIARTVSVARRDATRFQVDETLRLLGRHEARLDEIVEAMSASHASTARRERHELKGRLSESTDLAEQRSLRERIAALEARELNVDRLRARLGSLASDAERCVLALDNLSMTVLDAPIEDTRSSSGRLAAALDRVDEASRELRDHADAEDEVGQLLRPDFAARRARAR